jgi:hypothetical protein
VHRRRRTAGRRLDGRGDRVRPAALAALAGLAAVELALAVPRPRRRPLTLGG